MDNLNNLVREVISIAIKNQEKYNIYTMDEATRNAFADAIAKGLETKIEAYLNLKKRQVLDFANEVSKKMKKK